jgi:hypothetical protein
MSELLKINVNDHTERKGQLTYLSWAWAWAEVLKIDPAATWVAHQYGPQGSEQPCMWIGETAIVHTSVTINGLRRECLLPVMDNRNNAVKMPDARKISDAIMRCMTKAIAMHGLGLYIYAGEDLPEADEKPESKPELKTTVIKATDGAGASLSADKRAEIDELALHMIECHHAGKDLDAIRLWYDPATFGDNEERVYLWSLLGAQSKLRSAIKSNKPDGAK